MREGKSSLKGCCDLGLKLESCWAMSLIDKTTSTGSFISLGHLATDQTSTYQSCNCFLDSFLIFMTLCTILHVYTQIKRRSLHSNKKTNYRRPNCMTQLHEGLPRILGSGLRTLGPQLVIAGMPNKKFRCIIGAFVGSSEGVQYRGSMQYVGIWIF